eukprot:scaffold173491_cov19-Tisochrysis_lutea.AAC.1
MALDFLVCCAQKESCLGCVPTPHHSKRQRHNSQGRGLSLSLLMPPGLAEAQALLATPQLTHELASLKASHVRLSPLLRVITTSLVARLSASAQGAVDALEAPLMELVQSGILEQ